MTAALVRFHPCKIINHRTYPSPNREGFTDLLSGTLNLSRHRWFVLEADLGCLLTKGCSWPMSACAHSVYRPHRHRPAPIRAAFVPRRAHGHFCRRHRQAIGGIRSTVDPQCTAMAPITHHVATSDHRGVIQIPIALRSSMATAAYPAVSSLEACPTPAH